MPTPTTANNEYQKQSMTHQQYIMNDNDQTVDHTELHENNNEKLEHIKFMHQQHYAKMHTMDRFAMQMPQQQQQQQQQHQLQQPSSSSGNSSSSSSASNTMAIIPSHYQPNPGRIISSTAINNHEQDHDLSINDESDNELHHTPINNEIQKHQQFQQPPPPATAKQTVQEQSLIDLNELDQEQLKQLRIEEEKQQLEFFNLEALNRLCAQSQFLYKVRGKKLEEVTNNFEVYREDTQREIRSLKHQILMSQNEKDRLEASLNQAHELCNQYMNETDLVKKANMELQEKLNQIENEKQDLIKKLEDSEIDIQNLHIQIKEQQKLDSLERVQKQHEYFIQQLREQYEKDNYLVKDKCAKMQNEINDKNEYIQKLLHQLEQTSKNAEMVTIDRSETVNRLSNLLNELQAKYDKDVVMVSLNNKNNMEALVEIEQKNQLIMQLNDTCSKYEEKIKLLETLKTDSNSSDNINTLKKELERLLNENKQKKIEIQNLQTEIEQVKSNPNPILDDQSEEIERLKSAIQELEQEKNDLNNDLMEKNAKLNELLEKEELFQQFQKIKNDYEVEMYNKQQHIEECEKLINQLQAQAQNQLALHNQQQQNQMILNDYEKQLTELKLTLTNKEGEINKMRNMYMEVCDDKNNLQDALKKEYDLEYEKKLKHQLEFAIEKRLEENTSDLTKKFSLEKSNLLDQYRKELELNIAEIKSLKESQTHSDKQCDQLRLEKANLEIKANRVETELKEKCLNLEKQILENTEKSKSESFQLEKELTKIKAELELTKNMLNNHNSKLENDITDLNKTFENEKICLLSRIDDLTKEKEAFSLKESELNEKLRKNSYEYESKLTEMNNLIKQKEIDLLNYNETDQKLKELQLKFDEKTDEVKKNQLRLNENELKLKELQELNSNLNAEKDKFKNELEDIKVKHESNMQTIKNELAQEKLRLLSELDKLKQTNEQLLKNLAESESSKQVLIKKNDEEIQTVIAQLEKKYEDDYCKFIDIHKENMLRTLSEKTQEHSKEKEDLIQMYEAKLNDCDTNEKLFRKQVKELKEKLEYNNNLIKKDISIQTETEIKEKEKEKENNNDTSLVPYTNDNNKDYITELLNKIASLEEVISNTDSHFELELEKLRQELDEEYQIKLKYELENADMDRQKLEQEIENLQYHLEKAKLNSNSDGEVTTNSSLSLLINSEDPVDYSAARKKYSKLKHELNIKEKEMETVEQAYRNQVDQIKQKFDEHLKQYQTKCDKDLQRAKQDLHDNYKKELNKAKVEIEKMELFVQKLKKTNSDSDKVIESLKQEMAKIKESHLAELTSMKLNSEREKESLKDNLEKSMKQNSLLEKQLDECEENYRKKCDLLRAELKHEYGTELTKMNSKMKDMQRSHSSAVEILKKQHQQSTTKYLQQKPQVVSFSCQTEMTARDIELLESFRHKYLDTLSRMKSDMLKEYDAQTLRISERVTKFLHNKLHTTFLPKISEILHDFHLSETMIRLKMDELEKELLKITASKKSSSSSSTSGTSSSQAITCSTAPGTSSSASSISLASPTTIKFNEKNNLKSTSTENVLANIMMTSNNIAPLSSAKRSASALISNQRPSNLVKSNANNLKNTHETSNLNTYSRSTSNLAKDVAVKNPDLDSSNKKLTPGYKYTSLRQSWSNLSQMNQLSPYSTISSSANSDHSNHSNNINKNILFEEGNLDDEDDDEINNNNFNSNLSPRYNLATNTKRNYQYNRPSTADSILSRNSYMNEPTSNGLLKKTTHAKNDDNQIEFMGHNERGIDLDEEHMEKDNLKNDKDYAYIDDPNIEYTDIDKDDYLSENTNFYTKYRVQNVRYKKKSSPNSSSSLSRQNPTDDLSKSDKNNPINTLYELSKSYKTVQVGESNSNKNTPNNNNNTKYTMLLRSNTSIESTSDRRSLHYLENNLDENNENDNMPIRLTTATNTVQTKTTRPTMRSASTVNGSSNYSTTSARSSLSSVSTNNNARTTSNSKPVTSTTAASLPRSQLLHQNEMNNHPISITHRSNSANKKIAGSTDNILLSSTSSNSSSSYGSEPKSSASTNNQHNLHSNSSASTQYHSISASVGVNLVKNATFQKKKPVFY